MVTDAREVREVRAGSRRPSISWREGVGYTGGAVLGAVLLLAAWAKLLDPVAFAEQIRIEGLDFLLAAPTVAFLALALEVGLGLALVLGLRRPWVLVPAVVLVVFFLVLNVRAYVLDAQGLRQEAATCGCFGNLVERTPEEALWQDGLLLIPSLALAFVGWSGRSRRFPHRRVALVAVLVVASLLFAWKAPELPLDDLATRLRPGAAASDLCAGRGEERICLLTVAPELASGEHLVILADLESDGFGASVADLNDYVLTPGSLPLLVLSSAPQEVQAAFFWTHGPSFEVRAAPPELLAPLYRRLPRSFLVADGVVQRTYSGLPPLALPSTNTAAFERRGIHGSCVALPATYLRVCLGRAPCCRGAAPLSVRHRVDGRQCLDEEPLAPELRT